MATLYGALALLTTIRFHQWAIRRWKVTQRASYLAAMAAAEVLMMLLTFVGSGTAYLPFLWVVGPLMGWLGGNWLSGGAHGDSLGASSTQVTGWGLSQVGVSWRTP
jgi:hypothetical protein